MTKHSNIRNVSEPKLIIFYSSFFYFKSLKTCKQRIKKSTTDSSRDYSPKQRIDIYNHKHMISYE